MQQIDVRNLFEVLPKFRQERGGRIGGDADRVFPRVTLHSHLESPIRTFSLREAWSRNKLNVC